MGLAKRSEGLGWPGPPIKMKDLDSVSKFNSKLGGHPESLKVKGVEASTGALGHGLSIAVGMAKAAKLKKQKHKIFVILGDGEITKKINLKVHAISEVAKGKIESAGGSVEIIKE